MADLNFFDRFLSVYGNTKYCWGVHVRRMNSRDLPHCSYKAFHGRVHRLHRPLDLAINTPCREMKKGKKQNWWDKFISLFK